MIEVWLGAAVIITFVSAGAGLGSALAAAGFSGDERRETARGALWLFAAAIASPLWPLWAPIALTLLAWWLIREAAA